MVDTFGMTLDFISKPYKFEFFQFVLLSFNYCLTTALIWLLLFRHTIESRYFCYYVTSLKTRETFLGILKERLFQGHLSFELLNLLVDILV